MNPSAARTRTQCARLFAEPNAVGENQIRGGGVGGRSIRIDTVASSIAKVWPLKRGVENLSEVGQKRISVEHETVQQLLGWDSCPMDDDPTAVHASFCTLTFRSSNRRFRHRDHVRPGHFWAEKRHETDDQQSTHPGSADDASTQPM